MSERVQLNVRVQKPARDLVRRLSAESGVPMARLVELGLLRIAAELDSPTVEHRRTRIVDRSTGSVEVKG